MFRYYYRRWNLRLLLRLFLPSLLFSSFYISHPLFSFFSGLSAAKHLADNGVEDIIILEASDSIGGRIRKQHFSGHTVELGAGWIAGVGGKDTNPIWELAKRAGLRTCFSDYSNARYNIYDRGFHFLSL